jgi:hypothetical protein
MPRRRRAMPNRTRCASARAGEWRIWVARRRHRLAAEGRLPRRRICTDEQRPLGRPRRARGAARFARGLARPRRPRRRRREPHRSGRARQRRLSARRRRRALPARDVGEDVGTRRRRREAAGEGLRQARRWERRSCRWPLTRPRRTERAAFVRCSTRHRRVGRRRCESSLARRRIIVPW